MDYKRALAENVGPLFMINVLHFISLSAVGGVQVQFSDSFHNLCERNRVYNHFVVTKGVDARYIISLDKILKIGKINDLFKIFFLLLFRQNILHIYNRTASPYVRFISLISFRSKIIIHERGNIWNINDNQLRSSIENCRIADRVICNSNATANYIMQRCGVSAEKIKVVHNGINVKRKFLASAKVKRKRDTLSIAFIGRIEPHKGLSSLLSAMGHLHENKYFLNVVGDGVLMKEYEELYGAKRNIKFLGRKDNVLEFLYHEVDVLVVPSVREPLGNVCLEAGLTCATVIASNVDGLPEIIEHSATGILIDPTLKISDSFSFDQGGIIPQYVINPKDGKLVKPRALDPINIKVALENIRKNSALRKRLAVNLQKKVITEFSIESYNDKLIKIYDEIYESI